MTSARYDVQPTVPRLPADTDDGLPKDPVPVLDHTEEALGRFTTRFRDKPRLSALVRAFMAQVQELERVLFDVALKRRLDVATAGQLDVIGRLVNQPRAGLTDARYRRFIRARILMNSGRKDPDRFIEALKLLAEPEFTHRVNLQEYYPATVFLELLTPLRMIDEQQIADFLGTGRPAGVRMQFIYQEQAENVRFTFGTGTSTNQGWSSTVRPLSGGQLSGVREA